MIFSFNKKFKYKLSAVNQLKKMKKLLGLGVLMLLLFSCNNKKEKNMIVKGTINGFKKGTVYLQKMKDTTLTTVDSLALNGTGNFMLTDNVDSPEMYFLSLDKNSIEKISFFGEVGEITINTRLEKFATSFKIKGLKNQELLDAYNAMIQKFNDKQLDILKEKFDAHKTNDTATVTKANKEEQNLIKRKYLYTTNYAIQNANKEIAPYLALAQLYNANIKLLDTVNNSLSPEIKKSKYGIELQKFILKIKATEN